MQDDLFNFLDEKLEHAPETKSYLRSMIKQNRIRDVQLRMKGLIHLFNVFIEFESSKQRFQEECSEFALAMKKDSISLKVDTGLPIDKMERIFYDYLAKHSDKNRHTNLYVQRMMRDKKRKELKKTIRESLLLTQKYGEVKAIEGWLKESFPDLMKALKKENLL